MKEDLSSLDRRWLDLVEAAAACNPFTSRRVELDERIAAGRRAPGRGVHPAVGAVADFVRRLEERGRGRLSLYAGRDRERIRTLLLFHLFHEYHLRFDDHIREQEQAGVEPRPVPFAGECLDRMEAYGFGRGEALRNVAVFFQLRRAYHFIQRGLAGRGPSMADFRAQLWNNVFTHDFLRYEKVLWNRMEDFSTLLLGETGTGKGSAASAIGRSGFIPFDPRRGRFAQSFTALFHAVNLSQFSEKLIESELFGHRKGAFTGAVDAHDGWLARCPPNGAIFLDEIGDLAAPLQIKLLRVLQERTFSPVGSHEERRFSGRVIAATNRPMEDLLAGGRFRADFYYRLCSDRIGVPPLRVRLAEEPAELDDLLEHILARICGAAGTGLVSPVRIRILDSVGSRYGWPGNVRELEQAARSVLLKGEYPVPARRCADESGAGERLLLDLGVETPDAKTVLSLYCRFLHDRHGTYGEVARITGLDRRTVKRHIEASEKIESGEKN